MGNTSTTELTLEEKKCSKCGEVKPLEGFCVVRANKDGRNNTCKECKREYLKGWYQANKETVKAKSTKRSNENRQAIRKQRAKYYKANKETFSAKNKAYREANKEKIRESLKKWYQDNREKVKEYNASRRLHRKQIYQEWYAENKHHVRVRKKNYRSRPEVSKRERELAEAWRRSNKEKVKDNRKKYFAENKKEINRKRRKHVKDRLNKDPAFKLSMRLRQRLGVAIKKDYRSGSAVRDLGCSVEELKKHLESQFNSRMNWKNWGEYWQVDHIYPLTAANLEDRAEFLAVNNWRNLQPLEAKANVAKGDKVTPASHRLFNKLVKEFS